MLAYAKQVCQYEIQASLFQHVYAIVMKIAIVADQQFQYFIIKGIHMDACVYTQYIVYLSTFHLNSQPTFSMFNANLGGN